MTTATAQPITHHDSGIHMRSFLEIAWADWLDDHAITWAYEAERLKLGRITYCPDFWLPDLRTVLEVKGIVDDHEEAKLAQIAPELAAVGELLILGLAPAGTYFRLVWPTPDEPGQPFRITRDAVFVRCALCDSWQYVVWHGGWTCRVCGHADGGGTFSAFEYPQGRR